MKFCLTLLLTLLVVTATMRAGNAGASPPEQGTRKIFEDPEPDELFPDYYRDCQEIGEAFPESHDGVYIIQPAEYPEPFKVFCDFTTEGGGWTVIQRRDDGTVDFYLGWDNYKLGFGNLQKEFWLGNEKIHSLTNQKRYELRIEMTGQSGPQYYAKYTYFRISGEDNWYKLSIGSFSGSVGYDSLLYHNGMYFSTKDADHDTCSTDCAGSYSYGAWWFNCCDNSNLNGKNVVAHGIRWYKHPGGSDNLKYAEMKIRAL